MLYRYQYFYITRTLINMFYSGGAKKKNAIREILKFDSEKIEEDDSSSSDSSRSRTSRSRTSRSRSNSRNTSDNDSSDSDEEHEYSVYKTKSRTTANHSDTDNSDGDDANPDQNDYIVTLSSNDASGQHYHYAFIEEELEYELEEFVETHPEIVIYRTTTTSQNIIYVKKRTVL